LAGKKGSGAIIDCLAGKKETMEKIRGMQHNWCNVQGHRTSYVATKAENGASEPGYIYFKVGMTIAWYTS